MIKVLVVGQTPPPYGGQAMMIQRLVNARFEQVEILHVRMAFSDQVKSIGKVSLRKVWHLFEIIFKVYKIGLSQKKLVLYYPPAGPDRTPIIRDLIMLFFIKPLFYKRVYHYRAAGISDYLKTRSSLFQFICKRIYGNPDIAIQLSLLNPKDGAYFGAKRIIAITNGLEDEALNYLPFKREFRDNAQIKILFVGVLREDKGLTVLIEALNILKQKGITNISVVVMGEFTSMGYETQIKAKLESCQLHNSVLFVGNQISKAKWNYFAEADILCFPTFFNSESFGNVILEAMMFQLPVIATDWRGIPDIVTNETGFLTPIKSELAIADKIEVLMNDKELRLKMGTKGRERYLKKFTLPQHLHEMESMFLSLADS